MDDFAELNIVIQDIHKCTYIAILRNSLKEVFTIAELAKQIGITREYFESVISEYSYRNFSYEISEKIADILQMDIATKQEFLYHAKNVGKNLFPNEMITKYKKFIDTDALNTYIDTLHKLRSNSHLLLAPWQIKETYTQIIYMGLKLLNSYKFIKSQFRQLIDVYLLLHDNELVINKPAWALFHAQLALHTLLKYYGDQDIKKSKDFPLYLQIIRAIGLAYNNLNLMHNAAKTYKLIFSDSTTQQNPFNYLHTCINLASSQSRIPRSSVEDLKEYIFRARKVNEKLPIEQQVDQAVLIDRSEIQLFLHMQSFKKTQKLINQFESQYSLQNLSYILQVRFWETIAQYHFSVSDISGWTEIMRYIIPLAKQTGLEHQLLKMRRLYNTDFERLEAEL